MSAQDMKKVKQFAKETTRMARAEHKHGKVAKELIAAIDESFFTTVKAANKGQEELAHEAAAIGVDLLAKLRAV